MAERKRIFEIAIVGRLTWNLHSLNNEGTIGNVTEPRTVVLWDGTKTDGVSGEMMKHIHAFWTWLQAREKQLPLCQGCQTFHPQRADIGGGLPSNPEQAIDAALTRCALCDLHGFLVQRPTVHRQSTIEFGWVVGIRERTQRDLHVHARHAMVETQEGQQQRKREEVSAQMPYHRPTRSGVYAFVTLFQPWRIGLNEVNYRYAVSEEEQRDRFLIGLMAYEWTFKRPDGAMTTTRLPHIEGAEGLILVADNSVPVPLLSPLRDDYRQQLKRLAERQGVTVYEFGDLWELAEHLSSLREAEPLRLFERQG